MVEKPKTKTSNRYATAGHKTLLREIERLLANQFNRRHTLHDFADAKGGGPVEARIFLALYLADRSGNALGRREIFDLIGGGQFSILSKAVQQRM